MTYFLTFFLFNDSRLKTNDGIKKTIFEDKVWDFPPVRDARVV